MSDFWDREVVERQHIEWMALLPLRLHINELIGGGNGRSNGLNCGCRADSARDPDGLVYLDEYVGPSRFEWTAERLARMIPPKPSALARSKLCCPSCRRS
jgi:hypothetical protein